MAKTKVTNISGGARGAYLEGKLVMAERGETIETDEEVNEEWFAKATTAEAKQVAADPLDHDGDGRKGGHIDNKKG